MALLGPPKGPVLASIGPFGGPGGPRRAPWGQIWSRLPPIGPFGLDSCSPHTLTWYRAPSGHPGALKEPVLAPNAPRRSSEGSERPDSVPNAPDWSAWVGLMPTTHFDLVLGPFWVPGGAKMGYLAPVPKFPRPNFVMDIFCFKYRLLGCPEHRSGIPCSSSTVIANLEPPSSRKRSKTGKQGLFGPQNTLLGAP